jgi:hypothetical protein
MDGGRGFRTAPALWLNTSIRAQTATETSASLFERVFGFIVDLVFQVRNSKLCAKRQSVARNISKHLSINKLTDVCIFAVEHRNRKVFQTESIPTIRQAVGKRITLLLSEIVRCSNVRYSSDSVTEEWSDSS